SGRSCSETLAALMRVAEIPTVAGAVTGAAAIGKEALVAPSGTTTDSGTVASAWLLLESPTTTPPGPAGCASVTRPAAVWPPTAGFGETVSALAARLDASYSTRYISCGE